MRRTAELSLVRLREGNARFSQGHTSHHFSREARAATALGQAPFAIIVGCSDSRVPVEAVFDVGVGDLFVVRTAGHVLAAASLASVRFAVEKLGVPLIVVLGHEDCGAVSAALAGDAPEWLRPVVDQIDVSHVDVSRAPADAEDALLATAVDDHVRDTVAALREFINEFAPGAVVAGAAYKLSSGQVHWLDN